MWSCAAPASRLSPLADAAADSTFAGLTAAMPRRTTPRVTALETTRVTDPPRRQWSCYIPGVRPIDIVHHTNTRSLVITWEDSSRSEYTASYLRGWCPCAECQGHSNLVRYHPTSDNVSIAEMWEVGAYAVGLKFSDGHDKGIFRWTWLRDIRHEAAPEGPKTGRFVAGLYVSDAEVH